MCVREKSPGEPRNTHHGQMNNNSNVPQLDFTKVSCFGREFELDVLHKKYKTGGRGRSLHPTVAFVEGEAGVGKHILVDTFESTLPAGENRLFCSGRFSEDASEPFSALVEVFQQLVQTMKLDHTTNWGEKLQDHLAAETAVLTAVIPGIKDLLPDKIGNVEGLLPKMGLNMPLLRRTSVETQYSDSERLKQAVRELVRTVCLHTRLVLFIDELQWAETDSLQLIQSILDDDFESSGGLFFIGGHREISSYHPLMSIKKRIVERITEIKLANLTAGDVAELISELTKRDRTEVLDLAVVAVQRTGGNPFFLVQYLTVLWRTNLLFFALTSYRWEYDLEAIIHKTDISDNVVDMIKQKIVDCQSSRLKFVMTTVACSGLHRIDCDVLYSITRAIQNDEECGSHLSELCQNAFEVESALREAAEAGFFEKLPNGRQYRFAHDRIRESAAALLPEGRELDRLNFVIGKCLHRLYLADNSNGRFLLIAAHKLNSGSRIVASRKDLLELAVLNLEAAELAMTRYAFFPALDYLKTGIGQLAASSDNSWDEHYDLMVKFNTDLARMLYCCGEHERVSKPVNEVLTHAKTFLEKVDVYKTEIGSLIHADRRDDAFMLTRSVLKKLGIRIPLMNHAPHTVINFHRVNRFMKGKTDAYLKALPPMTEKLLLVANDFLLLLIDLGSQSNSCYIAYLAFAKLMEMTLKHGYSNITGLTFAAYGAVFSDKKNLQDSVRFGRLALEFEKAETSSEHAIAICLSYYYCIHWVTPLHECIKPMLKSYALSMKYGDTEHLFYSCGHYLILYYCAGLRLSFLEADSRKYLVILRDYGFEKHYNTLLPYAQLVEGLRGKSKNPVVMTGDWMDQDACMKQWEATKNNKALHSLYLVRMYAGVYFNDLDLAEEMASKLPQRLFECGSPQVPIRLFYEALIAIRRARCTSSPMQKLKCLRIAKGIKRTFLGWLKQNAVNCHHMHLLIKAELASLDRKNGFDTIRRRYDDAIADAGRSGFLHHYALASECAGRYCMEQQDQDCGAAYIAQARDAFLRWEAAAKVAQLEAEYPFLEKGNDELGSCLKARHGLNDLTSDRHKIVPLDDDVAV